MFNELAKHHMILNNAINIANNNFTDKNLLPYIMRAGSNSTAEFIVKYMSAVQSTDSIQAIEKFAVEQVINEGLYLEFGVCGGTSINFLSAIKQDKNFYGFDSFEGLPEDWTDKYVKGRYTTHGILPQVNKNVRLIKGWFDETLPKFVAEHNENCAFIHVDCDIYSSTKTVFEFLKDRIVSGTIILFDEYFNYPGWQNNEHKAFKEFIEETRLNFEYISYNINGEQVVVKIK